MTINEMVKHKHGMYFNDASGSEGLKDVFTYQGYLNSRVIDSAIEEAGNGQPFNIMQPYITCYMWKRTA